MKYRFLFALLLVSIALVGVAEPGKAPDPADMALAQGGGPNFSRWSPAVKVGPPITSVGNYEACPFISKSGLDLYFRTLVLVPGTTNTWRYDIFVSHRDSVEDPWETPINLGPNINTGSSNELCSFVTSDGYWIYFVSNRTGAYGGSSDIWVSHRKDKRDDTGWEPPINLGPNINTGSTESGPSIFEDEAGQVVLYFTRSVGTPSRNKIYSCQMLDKVTAGPATPVAELNSASNWNDLHAFVRRTDGLEVIFASDRGGTIGLYDLWVSTRPTTSDRWSPPEKLGPEVNSDRAEARPSISWDGTTLYFWTDREYIGTSPNGYWNIDVYQATRTELPGPPQYTTWSAPVNLGPIVNSSDNDAGAFISADGRSLYFGSTRPGGHGGFDIWVSQRASVDDPWGPPKNLGPTINTGSNEQTPTLSLDGHWLYFASDRLGGPGDLDLYVSRRHNKRDDFGWPLPENLGSMVNTTAAESGPALFEDDQSGTFTLHFSSDRLMAGIEHIYASTLQPDQILESPCMLQNPIRSRPWLTFGPAALVYELNSLYRDVRPGIRKDGLEMFLDSNRPGTFGGQDLWVSTRASASDPWSTPKNLGAVVNSTASVDARPVLSFDGTELYFHSNRSGGSGSSDLYRCTRTKLK